VTRAAILIRRLVRTGLLTLLVGAIVPAARAQQQANNPYAQQRGNGEPVVGAPTEFRSKDGTRKGWKVVIPGNRPLATPAVVEGKVFLGGGFGSHEF